MGTVIISAAVGFCIAIALFIILWFKKLKRPLEHSDVDIYSTIEKFRTVGELIVFKVVTKEIITASDHWFGEVGKKYFRWLASNKKMAMIFQFNIDFKYNLHSPDFIVKHVGNNNHHLKMPKCLYESHITDISFYDEQGAKLLPWLLPHLITDALSGGFSEENKNRLIAEAKNQASQMANDMAKAMQSDVQKSAKQTLEMLAKSFGSESITIDFTDAEAIQTKVEYMESEKTENEVIK